MKTEKYANYRHGWTTMRNGLHYNTPILLYVVGCSMLNQIYFIDNIIGDELLLNFGSKFQR